MSLVNDVQGQAGEAARLLIAGRDPQAVESVQTALTRGARPESAAYLVDTISLAEGNGFLPAMRLESAAVIVLVLTPAELEADDLATRLEGAAETGVPVVLVLTEAPGVEVSFPAAGVGPKRVVGFAPDGKLPDDLLAAAVVDAAGEASVFLAAGLPVLREATCEHLISRTARQNGVIGMLFIIPGADMPVMTLNQAKMVLRMAAAHGEPVGVERALELLGVVGSGLGFRTLARQAVCALPGPGWALKGGVA
ncbi:MAG TPA: hypothetical protein ENH44_00025, partial [Actinobacteria bacterium]|nr:hypothetical protein [Actinomycetota bacterium]